MHFRSPQFIPALQGLRAVAAISVVIGHTETTTGWPTVATAPSLGVVLFFVISGFLMSHLYLEKCPSKDNIKDYIRARIARVYPLFSVVILMSVFLLLFVDSVHSPFFRLGWADLLPHLLLFGRGMTVWTISVEFQFYGFFILLWFLSAKLAPDHRFHFLAAIAVMVAGIGLLFGFPDGQIDLFRYAHLFLIGAALPFLGTHLMGRRVANVVLGLTVIGYGLGLFRISLYYDQGEVFSDPRIWLLCGLMVASAIHANDGFSAKLLGSPPMVWLGDLSFAIYLLHRPVMVVWSWLEIELAGLPLLATLLISTIFAAWLANVMIEVPARRLIRKAHHVSGRLQVG